MALSESYPCLAASLAASFHFAALREQLSGHYRLQAYRNELVIEVGAGRAVLFDFGVVVFWNVDEATRQVVREQLEPFVEGESEGPEVERFRYSTGAAANRIVNDHIELISMEPGLLLSVSHALAQSVKLAVFESRAVETIARTRHLPESLAQKGRISLNGRQMAQVRGQLFMTRSDIILNYDLLDTPDFFWENPEFQEVYTLVAGYLEIQPRTEVLSKRLETIHELLEMLADEQKHRHSSTLEWIIIWLIAAEILMSLFKWFS